MLCLSEAFQNATSVELKSKPLHHAAESYSKIKIKSQIVVQNAKEHTAKLIEAFGFAELIT